MCHAIQHSTQRQSARQSRYLRAAQLLLLTVAASFGYGLAVSPYFAVRDVQIRAPDAALAKVALAGTRVPNGASTLVYPVQRIVEQLESYPQIKKASVERDLPGRLIVHIQRRHPVAAIKTDEQWALVDEDGICVGTTTALPGSLIHIYGLTNIALEPGKHLKKPQRALLTATLTALEDCSATDGLVMDFADRYLVQIHSPSGVLGKLGSPDNLTRKIMMFLAIMEQLEEKGRQAAYIDVRIMDQPIWKPRPQS